MEERKGYVEVDVELLRRLCIEKFTQAGMPADEAEIVAESLVVADQRGVQTHGIVCVPRYLSLIRRGFMRAVEAHEVIQDTGAVEVWDGKRSCGQVLGHRAMLKAMKKAKAFGVGIVAVRCSNHFGAGAYYAQLAQSQGMIGIAMSTGSPTMAPWGGAERLIGNNPVAVAIPGNEESVVLDMAMSNVAFGKISNLRKAGAKTVPAGWALDADGIETTDIDRVESVIPMGAYKGFGLSLVVDILSGLLIGGGTGARAGDDADGPSCLFAALNIGAFGDPEAFAEALDNRIGELRNGRLAKGSPGIMMPGDLEAKQWAASQDTVWMLEAILEDLNNA